MTVIRIYNNFVGKFITDNRKNITFDAAQSYAILSHFCCQNVVQWIATYATDDHEPSY